MLFIIIVLYFFASLFTDATKVFLFLIEALICLTLFVLDKLKTSVKSIMRLFIFVILFESIVCAETIKVNAKFIEAINMVETGGKTGMIIGKHMELGALQVRKQCWKESGVKGKFTDCANKNYSIQVMTAYFNKHAKEALRTNNFEVLARRWNGGPNGDKKKVTINYWKRVKAFLEDKKK